MPESTPRTPPTAPQPGGTDPAVIVANLVRTWNSGAGQITVTFGGPLGDQWDVEHSEQRRTAGS